MTIKLYEDNPYLVENKAIVVSNENGIIVLDRTPFFAKGGGQEAEGGFIDEYEVGAVYEKDGIVYHECVSDLKVNQEVTCKINFEKRYDHMQQHTGEHILSGVVENKYGYKNVGFHIAEHSMRVDYNGYLNEEQLLAVEKKANDVIRQNIAIYQGYPDGDDARLEGFRFKKEIEGDIRIVDIEGVDCCACCGTHLKSTAEVGMIKIISSTKYKNGVRLNVLCGDRALDYYNVILKQSNVLSQLLSSNILELADGVNQLTQKKILLEKEVSSLKEELLYFKVKELVKSQEEAIFSFENIDNKSLKKMSLMLREHCDKDIFLFSELDGRLSYIFLSNSRNLQELNEEFKRDFGAKGGGSTKSVSGSVVSDVDTITKWMHDRIYKSHVT